MNQNSLTTATQRVRIAEAVVCRQGSFDPYLLRSSSQFPWISFTSFRSVCSRLGGIVVTCANSGLWVLSFLNRQFSLLSSTRPLSIPHLFISDSIGFLAGQILKRRSQKRAHWNALNDPEWYVFQSSRYPLLESTVASDLLKDLLGPVLPGLADFAGFR